MSVPVPALPTEVVDHVATLTCKQLRAELKRLKLNQDGLKKVLKERLLAALWEERAVKEGNVATANKDEVSVNDDNNLPKKSSAIEAPLDKTTSDLAKDVEMIDLAKNSRESNQPMDIENDSAGKKQEKENFVVQPLCANNKEDNKSPICKKKEQKSTENEERAPALQPIPAKQQGKTTLHRQEPGVGMDTAPSKSSSPYCSPMKMIVDEEEKQANLQKVSRSPMKIPQSNVKDVIKKLTAKSPSRITNKVAPSAEIAKLKKNAERADNEPIIADKVLPSTKSAIVKDDSTGKIKTASSDNDKSAIRLLSAPAIGGNLSSGSSGGKGNFIKSKLVKAKNEARMKRLAEIRGQVRKMTMLLSFIV